MDYEDHTPYESDLVKQLKGSLHEERESEFGAELDQPEELSDRHVGLYLNWINIYRFLKDVLAFHMNQDRQLFYLQSSYQLSFSEDRLADVSYEAVENTNSDIPKEARIFHPWYYSPHAYISRRKENGVDIGFHYHRREDHIARYNALVVDIDDGPDEATLEDKFEALDLKPHYFIRTRPFDNYFQLVFKLDPIRLGTGNRTQTLKKIDYMLAELYSVFGGDPQAAKANQLYRLPYTYRDNLEKGYVVKVIDHSDHKPYDLGDVDDRLDKATKGSHDTLIRYDYYEASKGDVLDSPPIKTLRGGTVPFGYRNTALTALSYAYAMDGYPVEEAENELTEWARNHTEGSYRDHPSGKRQELPEVVIRSCYANPKGIDWKLLADVETVEEGRIGEKSAKKVLKYMPKTKQVHRRKPPEELENDRYFMAVRKVLETIHHLQLESGGEGVEISTRDLAEKSDVSYGTLTNRITPVLDKLQLKTQYSNKKNKFNLIRGKYPYNTYAFINQNMYNRSKDSVISLWSKGFPEEFGKFVGIIEEINMWVKSVEEDETAEPENEKTESAKIKELDPRLRAYVKMVKRHGWDEVKETLIKAGRNSEEVKEAIKKYEPDVKL